MHVRAVILVGVLAWAGGCGEPFALTGGAGGAGGASSSVGGMGGAVGTTSSGGMVPCTFGKASCGAGEYCNTNICGAGFCATIPTFQTQDAVPVCGCDGVTYWNTSVALSFGAPVQHSSPCSPTEAKTCDTMSPCPVDLHCARDLTKVTGHCANALAGGACVGLPKSCGPTTAFGRGCDIGQPCGPVCDLIRNDKAYTRVASCP